MVKPSTRCSAAAMVHRPISNSPLNRGRLTYFRRTRRADQERARGSGQRHPVDRNSARTDAGPFDRNFFTETDDQDKTTIIFGDGINGMRLPTGRENITATYRVGLGSVGNVAADAISQLATRPFGVKAVASPLAAAGGVDRDGVDQGRGDYASCRCGNGPAGFSRGLRRLRQHVRQCS